MPCDLLPSNWCQLAIQQDFESHSNVVHLFGNGIFPEAITIHLVDLVPVDEACWNLDPVLMGSFSDPGLDG
jgi:hypothetical protein